MSSADDARTDHVVVGHVEKSVDTFPVGNSLDSVAAVAGPIGEEGEAVVCSYPGSADQATCRLAVYRPCEDGSAETVHAVVVKLPMEVVGDARVTHMASQVDQKSGGITFCLLTSSSVILSLNIPPRLSRSDSVWANRLASVSQRVTTVAGLTGPATSCTLLGPGWAAIGCADGNVTLAWLSTYDNGQETPSLCEKNLGLVARKSVWSKMTSMFRSSRSPSNLSAAVVGLVPLPNQELLSVTADGCCRRWSEPLSAYAGTPPASEANLEIFGGIVVSNFAGDELPGSLAVGRQGAAGAWVVSILDVGEDGSITEGPSIDLPLQPGSELLRLSISEQQLLVVGRSPENEIEILVGDISPENGGDGALAGFTVCATTQQQGKRKMELARGVTIADLEDLRVSHGGQTVSELCSLLPPPPFPLFYVADSCATVLSSRDFVAAWWAWTLISLGLESSPESLFGKLTAEKSVQAVHGMARSLLSSIDSAVDDARTAVGFVGSAFLIASPHSVSALRPVDDLFEESLLRFGMGHSLACGGAEDLLLDDEEASDPQRLCTAALMAGAFTLTSSTLMVTAAAGHIQPVVEACVEALNSDETGLRMVGEASNQIRDLKGAAREIKELIAASRQVPNDVLAGLAIWTEWALNKGALDSQCGAATVAEIRKLHDDVLGGVQGALALDLAKDTSSALLRSSAEGLTKEELLRRLMEYPVDAKEVLVPLALLLKGEKAENYVIARSILSDADNCTPERLAYVLELLTSVCVDDQGSLSSVLGSGNSLPQHCVRLCCQAGFFEAEITFAKLQGVDAVDLFDRALELRDWDTCLEALTEGALTERLSEMARELERCGELGWLMRVRAEKSGAAAATAGKLLDVIVSSARPETVRELEQLWAVMTKSGDREHAARLAIRGYLDNGGSQQTPEPARGLLAADCTTPPGEIPGELRQPEVAELVENSQPEVVLSTLDRLQCQKKCLLLAKASLKRMNSPRGVFVVLRNSEISAEGSRFLFVDFAWVQLRLQYVSLYSAVVELTHVSVGAVDPWRLCRIGSSLGLLKPAVDLARLAGLDPWSSCFLPFVELIRRDERPALAREDGEPSLMRYAFTRFDSVSPLQCDGSTTEPLWSTLLVLTENDTYALAHVLVYLLRVEKAAVPDELVAKLLDLDWLALLRAFMVTGELEQAADLAVQQVEDWDPQDKGSPMDLALILQVMEALDAAVDNGSGELVLTMKSSFAFALDHSPRVICGLDTASFGVNCVLLDVARFIGLAQLFSAAMVHQGEEAPLTYNISALLEAAFRGDVGGMQAILAANPTMTVNDQDYDKRTALHLAAAGGKVQAVKFLVENGAVLKPDRFGMLPIHDAVMNGHSDIRTMLADLDLSFAGGMCYLSPTQMDLLRDQLGSFSAEISLTGEELEAKMTQVFAIIVKEGVFAAKRLWTEIQYYFIDLGLHPKYFKVFTSDQIARHIHSLLAARKVAQTTKSDFIHFEIEEPDSAFFLATLDPTRVWETERKVANYLSNFRSDDAFSVVFMRSDKSPIQDGGGLPLGIFIVDKTHFQPGVYASKDVGDEENIKVVASEKFLKSKTEENQQFYQSLIHEAMVTRNAVVRIIEPPAHMVTKAGAKIVQFAAYDAERRGKAYMLEVYECLRSHKVMPRRMYVETFANGIVTYHMYFDPAFTPDQLEELAQTLRYASHFKHSPKRSALVWDLVLKNEITPEHAIFLISAAKFVFSFFPKETHEYLDLADFFKSNQDMKSKLDEMFLQTMSNSITYERIYDALSTHYALTLPVFEDFKRIATGECKPFNNDELEKRIDEEVWSRFDGKILKTLLKLNAHLQMTNFFKAGTAAAIAMRFDGQVVSDRPKSLFPVVPHAVYLIVGRNFYGFHIRFRDIARGGIRMIMSRNRQVYNKNCATLLEENYNLALTQQLKNKDIPEGGSKGTILLDLEDQHLQTSGRDAFNKYIDALLDCMMWKETGLASHLPREEILFFGPDENTAGFMDMGAYRAKARGYTYWKALTTGKSTKLGGVPHDKYGMTTNSIHEYVLQLLDALDIQESSVTKVMTGGPDGDLGSNEILISKDKTIAICDGSGVLYDPEGLDRGELTRLARERKPVSYFDRSKLSANPKSFLVKVDDTDVVLPNGQHYKSGVDVRNTFTSLEYCSADLFVPCGGRPATVNIRNIQDMFHAETKQPKFKFIVEGANLFFTDDARRVLEDAGVHLFKDASTNKGGVTSSSLEVFAALCMDPDDHEKNLTVKDPNSPPPEFYEQYAQEIISVIRHNARMEFNGIWTANHEVMVVDGSDFVKKIDASAMLSRKINHLKAYIMEVLEAEDPENDWMVRAVLRRCVPRLLLVHCGLDQILERTPEAYIMATVATWIASTFVYKYGLNASEFAFYQFMRSLEQSSGGEMTPADMGRPRHLGSFSL